MELRFQGSDYYSETLAANPSGFDAPSRSIVGRVVEVADIQRLTGSQRGSEPGRLQYFLDTRSHWLI